MHLFLLLLLFASSPSPVTGLLPPLPWTFPNARVLYQPALVPFAQARAVTPPDMPIISLFGFTLGGVFVVEWTASPVGPYREVAVLSSLVLRGFNLGAWASHIVVTEDEAMLAARSVFGLPAVVGNVEFCGDESGATDAEAWANAVESSAGWLRGLLLEVAVALKYATGAATPGVAEPAERLDPRLKAHGGTAPTASPSSS